MQFSFNYVNKNNEFFLIKFPLFFLVLLNLFLGSLSDAKELAKFKDWQAFAEGEGKNLACMAVSKPKKSEGDYSKRGDVFAIITHLPGQKKWNEFSVVAGYNYKTNSNPEILIDQKSFNCLHQVQEHGVLVLAMMKR